MEILEKAKALFTQPLSLDGLRKLDRLERQATGKERMYIGLLWDAAYAAVDPIVLQQARVEGLL
ncbi:hypothetical protein C9J48_12595 [Photobacterium profundum]|jgi:hypothetical protein|uniref:Uncharacterized protein n=2 Tax=Photobacterium TaxID=657 RepID=Q1Z671_9GAMM|nr:MULTISPECIES: hypothetical protein [Photobacterium]EAS43973.1 hypothetical protein P3TCK_12331 [Photobacterium profundum 3TCK]PSV49525.1 hypothetical protein C9J47_02860 [Photobacterium indicum]PSV61833.1 hypothetical protein C9J48_12595 [Photobacterium profundum]